MTTPFLETPRFPDDLAYWARGGVCFSTTIAETTSGREQRNILWKFGRGSWDLQNCFRTGDGVQDAYSVQTLRNFFRIVKGQAYGFRFRDFTDYMDEGQGLLGIQTTFGQDVVPTGAGNGTPTLQLYKKYAAAPLADYRLIAKPLAVQLQRNGATLVAGSSPGNYSLDTTTGLVTFVADNSAAVTGWTPGATTQFTVASVPSGWTVGKMLYFTGVTGTGASAVNGVAVAITAVAGTTITLGVSTTGLTLSGGTAALYPQVTDSLTWTGTFDTPARFATDSFQPQPDIGTGALYGFQTLTLVEIRT
ncbi:DUF2460 domain-containing protein [Burkholderia sp. JKS000303]|uniref:DUF2460 domain-containing protein n=1 Tax=Burkholderia sp. JKS000303 TaxID=1938747 RepID=UPI000BF4442F|nr:DUF2460 domain-containing protein [Burkholderia sp. JKS000303]PFH26313.1 uncharacterized protein (TIGR02217 family) [Burkholderia sp. JKS000303]PFH29149.1 uncharacterized protein (TIGR02217 family) [Burkholderia sp. JKS000303]